VKYQRQHEPLLCVVSICGFVVQLFVQHVVRQVHNKSKQVELWLIKPPCLCGWIGTVNSLRACPPVKDFSVSDSELKHHILHHPCGDSCSSSSSSSSGDTGRNGAPSSVTSSSVTSDTMTRLRIGAGLIHSCARDIRQHMVSNQTCHLQAEP